MRRILVTGANGFIGNRLCGLLQERGYDIRTAIRSAVSCPNRNNLDQVEVGEINRNTFWKKALHEVSCVIHLAARVHIMKDSAVDPLAEYRKINVDGTLNLASQAAEAGVRRFLFISTIKVNGENTDLGKRFTEKDQPAPVDAYSISKYEAEQKLRKLADRTGMEVVVIRPVLVYGPGVKGNFSSMMNYIYKGLPLPFGAIHNQRSFVALDNLVDLIIACTEHPAAANQIFLVSDGDDMSTTELFQKMARALNVPLMLVPVPEKLLMLGAAVLGRQAQAHRLLGSLQVDITKAQVLLGWHPPVTVEKALDDTAHFYLKNIR